MCIGFTWELGQDGNMSESASVDEFIRHMQAELESCEDIVDKVERQKRQWQIESSLLLAMDFSKKFKELSNLGQNPMKIIEALQVPDGENANAAKLIMAIAGGVCPTCGTQLESDLNFCSSCGNYAE